MNTDEYTSPLENIDNTKDYEEVTGHSVDEEHCPSCGSNKVSVSMIEMDDKKFHEEMYCRACGFTSTN